MDLVPALFGVRLKWLVLDLGGGAVSAGVLMATVTKIPASESGDFAWLLFIALRRQAER